MRTEKIGKYLVEIYDSIDELPVHRFHKYNKYMLIDSGIGSDLDDFNRHLSRIKKFMVTEPKEAHKELENLRQSLYLISNEINPKHLSLIPLIKKIDGYELFDLSDENIRRISKRLSKVKVSFLDGLIEAVKKKNDEELSLYFPNQFDDVGIKEYYDRLRERVLLQLDSLIRGNDNNSKIEEIQDYFLTLAKPQIFNGKHSVEIKSDKQFEEACLFLRHQIGVEPEKMTVLQFYNSFEYLKKTKTPNRKI